MSAHWSGEVDEILDGDRVAMLVCATPARGAVLLPVTNFAVRDRTAGTLTAVNSSVGVPRKLERIRRSPKVALAYHARAHGLSARPEYVLVQGTARLSHPIPGYPDAAPGTWGRVASWEREPWLWRRWLRAFALRVEIEIDVERVIVWSDLSCAGEPRVDGPSLPPPPAAQSPPKRGTWPRIDVEKATDRAARLPHVLLGWIGGDGYPVAVRVEVASSGPGGMRLVASEGAVPAGGRRAGLTAHWFSRGAIGQNQRKHTGWLEARDGNELVYAPHTSSAYRLPESEVAFRLVSGAATRWGMREARRLGFVP